MTTADTLDRNDQGDTAPVAPSELALLKARADTMNIKYSNNIGLEALRAKVNAKMDGEPVGGDDDEDASREEPYGTDDETDETAAAAPARRKTKREIEQEIRETLQREQMKLVRLRITNLDPKKKDLPGEILTIANEYLGTVRKFVPFGEHTDNGYHVPFCIYQMMKDRKFLNIRTYKKNGQIQVSSSWATEFALEELPPLSEHELAQLAASQAAKGGFSDGME